MNINYLKLYSPFKNLLNNKWYIYNQNNCIYYVLINEILYLKYHIAYSNYEDYIVYELNYDDFKTLKKELEKKKNTVNIQINQNKQLYLSDKNRLIDLNIYETEDIIINTLETQINCSNFKTTKIDLNNVIDLGEFGGYRIENVAYKLNDDSLVSEEYINKLFKYLSLDEVVFEIDADNQLLKISNLDNDLQIYIKLIVRY